MITLLSFATEPTCVLSRVLVRLAQVRGWRVRSWRMAKTSTSVYVKLRNVEDGRKIMLRVSDHMMKRIRKPASTESKTISVVIHRPEFVLAAVDYFGGRRPRR